MFFKKASDSPEFEAGDLTLLKELAHPIGDKISIGYSLAQARLPIGKASLPHVLKGSELYYILQGEGCLYINEAAQNMTVGSLALVPPGAKQHIENIGKEELVFLCIVEPYWRPDDETVD